MKRKVARNYNFLDHYTYYVPGVADIFILLALLLLGSLIGNGVSAVFMLFLPQEVAVEYSMLLSYPVMFIPAMIYASSRSRRHCLSENGVKLDSSHFGRTGGALCALLVSLATMALAYCSDAITSVMPEMPEYLKTVLKSLTQGTLWVNLVCVSVFAPLFEEWLCRGQVLRGLLANGIKPVWAIIISAVFFAVIHLNPWQAVPAFLIGCLLGYVYYKTGSLRLTMLMHCVNNTSAVLFGNMDSLKEMESWKDVIPSPDYWVIFLACVLLVIFVVRVFSRIEMQNATGNSDVVPPMFGEQL